MMNSKFSDLMLQNVQPNDISDEELSNWESCRHKNFITVLCVCCLRVTTIIALFHVLKHAQANDITEPHGANAVRYSQNEITECKIEVDTHYSKPEVEEKVCDGTDYSHIVNGSCFLCGNVCKSYTDVKEKAKENSIICQRSFSCCDLQYMCQLNDLCNGGECKCFDKNPLPRCVCPKGKKELHCNEIDKEELLCNCSATANKFNYKTFDQSCNDTHKAWTKCHTFLYILNEQHECLCQKNISDLMKTPSCTSSHADLLINGANRINPDVSTSKLTLLFFGILFKMEIS